MDFDDDRHPQDDEFPSTDSTAGGTADDTADGRADVSTGCQAIETPATATPAIIGTPSKVEASRA